MLITTATTWAETETVSYIDADGKTQSVTATVLTGGGATTLDAGWYVVNSDITYTGTVTLSGDVTLILADGCHMSVGTSSERIDDYGINGYDDDVTDEVYALTITSQSTGNDMGALSVYITGYFNYAIYSKALTINGGNITADTEGTSSPALGTSKDAITINGGTVRAITTGTESEAIFATGDFNYNGGNVTVTTTVSGDAIRADGKHYYNFSWRSPADCITLGGNGLYSDPDDPDSYTATFSKAFTDGTTVYSTKLTGSELNALSDKTLYPYVPNLSLAANAHGGNCWTTFYCGHTGYKIDDGENACAYTAEYDGTNSQLTLHKLGKVIPKGNAVIIVGEDNEISMTASTEPAEYSVSNDLHGVDVRTEKATLELSNDKTGTFYVMGKKGDDFGFFEYTGDYMPARKAYLLVNSGAAQVKGLTMVFDGSEDATSIQNSKIKIQNEEAGWYSLNGRKLDGKPTAKGIFIHNGKKVVVK